MVKVYEFADSPLITIPSGKGRLFHCPKLISNPTEVNNISTPKRKKRTIKLSIYHKV